MEKRIVYKGLRVYEKVLKVLDREKREEGCSRKWREMKS